MVTVGERELSPHVQFSLCAEQSDSNHKASLRVCLALESSEEDIVSPLLWQ